MPVSRYDLLMRIAIATCRNLPDWEVDDTPLFEAFAARDIDAPAIIWDDPGVEWSTFDACLIRTTWDYQHGKREAFVDWAQRTAAMIPLFNPPLVIRWNTHKFYLRELEQRGAPIIPTIWLEAGSSIDLPAALHEHGWSRAFLKPAIGATARETFRIRGEGDHDDAQAHVDRLLAAGEDMLLQPYLPRVETEGEYSAIIIDGSITHGVRKVPVPGDYRVQDDFGATDEPWTPTADDQATIDTIIDALPFDHDLLYARVDLIRDDAGALRLTELELVEPGSEETEIHGSGIFETGILEIEIVVEIEINTLRPD